MKTETELIFKEIQGQGRILRQERCGGSARGCGTAALRGDINMRISYLQELLQARLLCGEDRLEEDVDTVFSSDMMSDVRACPDEILCLLTGLINSQVIRTADMMDIGVIVFVRGKCPPDEVVEMARQRDMVVLVTACRMFSACGRLYEAGLGCR